MRRTVIDRMALLCTLHADGPRTLRTLREAGCTSLSHLGQLSPDRVGKLLGLPSAAARRLTREAQRLVDRLEPDLEQEEVTYPPAAEAAALMPGIHSYRLSEARPATERTSGDRLDARSGLDLRDRELLDRVVARWRNEDTTDPLAEVGVGPEELDVLAQVELRDGRVDEVDESVTRAPERDGERRGGPAGPQPAVVRDGLRPGAVAGLDAHACCALLAAGVGSLEDLATGPVDELRERSGLGYTRVRTLQFLAGRRLAEAAPPSEPQSTPAPVAPAERLSPAERPLESLQEELQTIGDDAPRWEVRALPRDDGLAPLDDGGAAGPFA